MNPRKYLNRLSQPAPSYMKFFKRFKLFHWLSGRVKLKANFVYNQYRFLKAGIRNSVCIDPAALQAWDSFYA